MNLLPHEEPVVYLVAGDPQVSRPLQAALKPHAVSMELHVSGVGFLKSCDGKQPGCVVWDVAIRNPNDRELFRLLEEHEIHLPVIFISDSADTAGVVRAMKAGALNYLEKPLAREAAWEAIQEALAWDAENRARLRRAARIRRRIEQLTAGEKEVLQLLLGGNSNRRMADGLGLSVRTIEVRRAKLMKKMKARSLPELVRLAMTARNDA